VTATDLNRSSILAGNSISDAVIRRKTPKNSLFIGGKGGFKALQMLEEVLTEKTGI